MSDSLEALRGKLREFSRERDWEQFQSAKNLAAGVSVEAGELLEQFLWQDDLARVDESRELAISHELADVLIYLIRLSDVLGIDLIQAANDKIALNASRYPIELAKGNAKKHTELR